jgi:hypothetical protein
MSYTEDDFKIMQAIHDDAQRKAKQRIADFVENRRWNEADASELELFFIDVEFVRESLTAWGRL